MAKKEHLFIYFCHGWEADHQRIRCREKPEAWNFPL